MKKFYYAIGLSLLVSVVATAVLLILSPDVVPMHYNAAGQVDRYGSKYENLIWPGFSLVMAASLMALAQYQRKKQAPELEQKVVLATAVFTIGLFTGLEIIFGILAINHVQQGTGLQTDAIARFVGVGIGVILMVFGNVMPKARRNSLFGLRTQWSMASDSLWRKSQRFGGISGVLCGLLLTVLAVVLPKTGVIFAITVLTLLWALVCVVASYLFWKKSQKNPA